MSPPLRHSSPPSAATRPGPAWPRFPRPVWLVAVTVAVVTVASVAVPLVLAQVRPAAHGAPPAVQAARSDVIAHLMDWKWTDIATECTQVLGPRGYGAVQVSPPQEHAVLPTNSDNTPYPWWQRYQPVSYQVESRSGSREEFRQMAATCEQHGVKIYVDAIVNHMTGRQASGTGSGGSGYDRYSYPAVPYGGSDFHGCRRDIADWNNRTEVQNCELLGLVDLSTETDHVRGKLLGYLNDLVDLGVDGFRIDAAKHVPVSDLQAILPQVDGDPFIYSEVLSEWSSGAPPMQEYQAVGSLIEWHYGPRLSQVFTGGNLGDLATLGQGYAPGATNVVYVDSHDTQRTQSTLTYHDGQALYTLGNVFMLAWPYGRPMVMSSFQFGYGNTNVGPPSDANGNTNDVSCGNGWLCEHRWNGIATMVDFRATTAGAPVEGFTAYDADQISFRRQGKGFVAINRGGGTLSRTFDTGLPAGTYCNAAAGELRDGACTGPKVTVDSAGRVTATVGAVSALAIHIGARETGASPTATATATATGSPTSSPTASPTTSPTTSPTSSPTDPPDDTVAASVAVTATTYFGQNVYIVGSVPQLGNWDPARAVPLSSATYPTWQGDVTLPAGTTVEYKYLKKNPDGTVTWESRGNRSVTTPSSGSVALRDRWDEATAPLSTVAFDVHAATTHGQHVFVVGNLPALGGWDPAKAIPLSSAGYPQWRGTVVVPAGTTVAYKYLKKNPDGTVIWENGENRGFATGPPGASSRVDTWR